MHQEISGILTREADMGFKVWQVVTLSTGKKALMLPNDTPEVVGSFAPRRKWGETSALRFSKNGLLVASWLVKDKLNHI